MSSSWSLKLYLPMPSDVDACQRLRGPSSEMIKVETEEVGDGWRVWVKKEDSDGGTNGMSDERMNEQMDETVVVNV